MTELGKTTRERMVEFPARPEEEDLGEIELDSSGKVQNTN